MGDSLLTCVLQSPMGLYCNIQDLMCSKLWCGHKIGIQSNLYFTDTLGSWLYCPHMGSVLSQYVCTKDAGPHLKEKLM